MRRRTDPDSARGAAAERQSRSERKREAHALQTLGEALVDLPAARLDAMPLSEEVREVVVRARGLSGGAYRRAIRRLGKLLGAGDAEAVRAALAAVTQGSREAVARLHRVERWRDRLVAEGDPALGELAAAFPAVDRQRIRCWLREVRGGPGSARGRRAHRALFRYLRELHGA